MQPMANEPQVEIPQEETITETQIEAPIASPEPTKKPILKAKDGRLFSMKQLMDASYTPERIQSGIDNGNLTEVGDITDHDQQYKSADGRVFNYKDLMTAGYDTDRIENGISNGKLTIVEKKSPSPSLLIATNGSQDGVSPSPSTTNIQETKVVSEPTPEPEPPQNLVDWLASKKLPYDKQSRQQLAEKYGIQGYDFSDNKNKELLDYAKTDYELGGNIKQLNYTNDDQGLQKYAQDNNLQYDGSLQSKKQLLDDAKTKLGSKKDIQDLVNYAVTFGNLDVADFSTPEAKQKLTDVLNKEAQTFGIQNFNLQDYKSLGELAEALRTKTNKIQSLYENMQYIKPVSMPTSVTDVFKTIGLPSDKQSIAKLAVDKGVIQNESEYVGNGIQDTKIINALKPQYFKIKFAKNLQDVANTVGVKNFDPSNINSLNDLSIKINTQVGGIKDQYAIFNKEKGDYEKNGRPMGWDFDTYIKYKYNKNKFGQPNLDKGYEYRPTKNGLQKFKITEEEQKKYDTMPYLGAMDATQQKENASRMGVPLRTYQGIQLAALKGDYSAFADLPQFEKYLKPSGTIMKKSTEFTDEGKKEINKFISDPGNYLRIKQEQGELDKVEIQRQNEEYDRKFKGAVFAQMLSSIPPQFEKSGFEGISDILNPETASNAVGYLWNNAWGGLTQMVGGLYSVVGEDLPSGIINIFSDQKTDRTISNWLKNDAREGLTFNLHGDEKRFADDYILSAAGAVANMLPAALVNVSGVPVGFMAQGYANGMDSINSTPEGKNLPEYQKLVFAYNNGIMQGLIAKMGIDKIFGNASNKLAVNTTINTIKKAEANNILLTPLTFEKLATSELNSIKTKALTLASHAGTGATFGLAMSANDKLLKKLLNDSVGRNVFETPSFKLPTKFNDIFNAKAYGEGWGEMLGEARQGALMGVLTGAGPASFNKVQSELKTKVMQADTPEALNKLREDIKNKANQSLTPDQRQTLNKIIDEYSTYNYKIPLSVINIPKRIQIATNLIRRDGLTKELNDLMEKKKTEDPAFHEGIDSQIAGIQKLIEGINKDISDLYTNQKSESAIITKDASDLVQSTDIPQEMTPEVQKVAEDNGIEVDENTTPQDVVNELKNKIGSEAPVITESVDLSIKNYENTVADAQRRLQENPQDSQASQDLAQAQIQLQQIKADPVRYFENLKEKTIDDLQAQLEQGADPKDLQIEAVEKQFDALIEDAKKYAKENPIGDEAVVEVKLAELPTKTIEAEVVEEKPLETKTETTNQKEIDRLRAEEQAELDSRIPNAEQYRVDGKVDRSKLTNPEDIKAFDEVYAKYDKLISPLLKQVEVTKTEAKPEAGSVGVGGDIAKENEAVEQTPTALRDVIINKNNTDEYVNHLKNGGELAPSDLIDLRYALREKHKAEQNELYDKAAKGELSMGDAYVYSKNLDSEGRKLGKKQKEEMDLIDNQPNSYGLKGDINAPTTYHFTDPTSLLNILDENSLYGEGEVSGVSTTTNKGLGHPELSTVQQYGEGNKPLSFSDKGVVIELDLQKLRKDGIKIKEGSENLGTFVGEEELKIGGYDGIKDLNKYIKQIEVDKKVLDQEPVTSPYHVSLKDIKKAAEKHGIKVVEKTDYERPRNKLKAVESLLSKEQPAEAKPETLPTAEKPIEEELPFGEVEKMEQKEEKVEKDVKKRALAIEAEDPLTVVLQYFISGGKINPSALRELFGRKAGAEAVLGKKKITGEHKARLNMQDNSAPSIKELAHQLWESQSEYFQDRYSDQDFRNAIEDVMLSHSSPKTMIEDIMRPHLELEAEFEKNFSPDEVSSMGENAAQKLKQEVENLPEDVQAEMLSILEKFQNEDGSIDWNKLENEYKYGFVPELLTLSPKAEKILNETIEKVNRQAEESISGIPGENVGGPEKATEPTAETTTQAEVKPEETPPSTEKVGKFEEKARKLAEKIAGVELPDFLKTPDFLKDVKKSGMSAEDLQKKLADAVVKMGKLLDKGVDFYEALKESVSELVSIRGEENREIVEKGFEQFYKQLSGEKTTEAGGNKPPTETPNVPSYSGTNAERQSGLKRNIMEAESIPSNLKQKLADNLNYKTASNAEAREVAVGIVDQVGENQALEIAKGDDMHPSVRSAIYAELIDRAADREKNAKTDAEKLDAAMQWADLVDKYSAQLTGAGQFTAYAGHYYKTSPLGFIIAENKFTKERFEEWMKTKNIDELYDELMKTEGGAELFEAKVEERRKQERAADRKKRDKKIDDFFDKLKINPNNTYGFVIPLSVLNPVIEGMRLAVKGGDRVVDIVQRAIDQISDKVGDNWDKEKFRKEYESALTRVADEGKKDKSREDQLKERINDLENQIKDYQEKIKKGGVPSEQRVEKFGNVEEVQKLIKERDELRRENQKLVKEARIASGEITPNEKKIQERIENLEAELDRVRFRREKEQKEKKEPQKIEYTKEEQDLISKIEEEQKKWDEEIDQSRRNSKDYKALESEINRQMKKISDLKEKLNILESGKLPEGKKREVKKDTPEIENLKSEVEKAEKDLRENMATKKRIDDLEKELDRLKQRKEKEPSETNKREYSDKEIELREKIENERLKWKIEDNISKLKAELDRVKNRQEKTTNPVEKRKLTDEEKDLKQQIKEESEIWSKEKKKANESVNRIKRYNKLKDELQRRKRENDFSAEAYKEKRTLNEQEQAAKDELDKVKAEYDEAKKQSPEWQKKKAQQFLDEFQRRAKGIDKEKLREIVRRSIKKIAESGGLQKEEFRKIVADVMGFRDLSPDMVTKIEKLTDIINNVAKVEDEMVKDPTRENIDKLRKAKEESVKAEVELLNMLHREADLGGTFASMWKGGLMSIFTLVKNPIQNLAYQAIRFSTSSVKQAAELALYGGSKITNKLGLTGVYKPTTNLAIAQKYYFSGTGGGVRKGFLKFKTGHPGGDFFGTTSYQSSLSPGKALRDYQLWKKGEKFMTTKEVVDAWVRKSWVARQSDFILRALAFGDMPARSGAQWAKAAQIAFQELGFIEENQIQAFIESPFKMAYKKFIADGVEAKDAEAKAKEVENRINEAGSRAVMEQENMLTQMLGGLRKGAKEKGGLAADVVMTTTFPFTKIYSNVMWTGLKLTFPELSLAESANYSRMAFQAARKGDKAKAREYTEKAKDSAATAAVGYGFRYIAAPYLQQNGLVHSSLSADEKRRVMQGERFYSKMNQLNLGKMLGGSDFWVDLGWFGPLGSTMDIETKNVEREKERKSKGEEPGDFPLLDDFQESAMGALNTLAIDNGTSVINAFMSKDKGSNYFTSVANGFGNIMTGGTYAAISKAMLPYEANNNADNAYDKILNNQKQRNAVLRYFAGGPPQRVSMWGEPIKKDVSAMGMVNTLLGFEGGVGDKFGAILFDKYQQTQDDRFFPMPEDNKLKVNGKDVELKTQEKRDLDILIGQNRKKLISPFIYDVVPFYVAEYKFGDDVANDPRYKGKDAEQYFEKIKTDLNDLAKKYKIKDFQVAKSSDRNDLREAANEQDKKIIDAYAEDFNQIKVKKSAKKFTQLNLKQQAEACNQLYQIAREAGYSQFIQVHPEYAQAELFGKERKMKAMETLSKQKNKRLYTKELKLSEFTPDQMLQLEGNGFQGPPPEEKEKPQGNNTTQATSNDSEDAGVNAAAQYILNNNSSQEPED